MSADGNILIMRLKAEEGMARTGVLALSQLHVEDNKMTTAVLPWRLAC